MRTKSHAEDRPAVIDMTAGNDDTESFACHEPDLEGAERFVEALTGARSTPVTFQTFLDFQSNDTGAVEAARKQAPPPQMFHGTVREHFQRLVALNRNGHGVFVMINEGDGHGRSKANVIALRANFIDDDGDAGRAVAFTGEGEAPFDALSPSITVQAKKGQHNYFCLVPGQALETFAPTQKQLAAHFKTDRAISDLPRVMRLPGFFHLKDPKNPLLVSIVQANESRYTIAQLEAAYPAPGGDCRTHREKSVSVGGNAEKLRRARAYAAKVPGPVQGEGGDNATFRLCCALAVDFDLGDDEALELLMEWNSRCKPPWSENDLRKKLRNARAYASGSPGAKCSASNGTPREEKDSTDKPSKRPVVALAIDLLAELGPVFGDDDRVYVQLRAAGGTRTVHLRSPAVRRWMRAEAWSRHRLELPAASTEAALDIIEAGASNGPPVSVCLRIGKGADDAIYIDIGDSTGDVIRVDEAGWSISAHTPGLLFRRTSSMKPLVCAYRPNVNTKIG